MVIVELDVSTRDERVDIDAESTSTISIPNSSSGRASVIIAGIIVSYWSLPAAEVLTKFLVVSAGSVVE